MEKVESKIQEMLEDWNPCPRVPFTDTVLSELIDLFLEHQESYLERQKMIFRLAMQGNLAYDSKFQHQVDEIMALMPKEEDEDDGRYT